MYCYIINVFLYIRIFSNSANSSTIRGHNVSSPDHSEPATFQFHNLSTHETVSSQIRSDPSTGPSITLRLELLEPSNDLKFYIIMRRLGEVTYKGDLGCKVDLLIGSVAIYGSIFTTTGNEQLFQLTTFL